MLDFPDNPVVGQIYAPGPPADSSWKWDGVKWEANNTAPQIGPPGPQGPPGTAATVDAGTTTTTLPGSNATVVNAGNTTHAVFNFGIPRGDVGAQGPTGPTGATGAQGPTGTAATATAGTTTTGAPGTNANVVNVGSTSAAVFNFTIPRGDVGATGPQGPTGASSYQAGPGLQINTGTTPPTIDVITPYLPIAGGQLGGNLSMVGGPTPPASA
jgi:hypothetical protein